MVDSQDLLTPERWDAVRHVLAGEDPEGCSLKFAAKRASQFGETVRARDIEAWVRRSEMLDPDDEPWVHEIHVEFSQFPRGQAQTLRDRKWQIANRGLKKVVEREGVETVTLTEHPQTIDRELEVRDHRYQKKPPAETPVMLVGTSVVDDLYQRHKAQRRLAQIRQPESEANPVEEFLSEEKAE